MPVIFASLIKIENMKYIAYYRVSTNKQNLGIDAQKNAVENYIKANNANLIGSYQEKESGKNDDRKELRKALEQCKKEDATLLIAKLDRLSRKVSFLFNLRDSGINFLSLDCPNFNTLTLGIFATLAQAERELISQRTKAALQIKKQNGVKLGTPKKNVSEDIRNLAYTKIKSNANENVNNKRAKCVIEALIKTTNNKAEIARKLNEGSFTTSKGGKFTSIQVIRLIHRYNISEIR